MKKYLPILFVLSLTLNTFIFAQESESDEAEISTVEALLQLVKEGKTKESNLQMQNVKLSSWLIKMSKLQF